MLFCIILFIANNVLNECYGYLYTVINNVEIAKYPEDIQFSIIQLNGRGLIFYTIDLYEHFISVKLTKNAGGITLIEFMKTDAKEEKLLTEFCGRLNCTNVKLDFRIINQNGDIRLSCNNVMNMSLKAYGSTEHQTAVQIFLGNKHSGTSETDPNQVQGCLVAFDYKSKRQQFGKPSNNYFTNCHSSCNDNICNGGQCIETYQSLPNCNCTLSIYNGQYCNERTFVNITNLKSWKETLPFKTLKLSWYTVQKNFFLLGIQMNDSIFEVYVQDSLKISVRNRKVDKILNYNSTRNVSNIIFIVVTNDSLMFKHDKHYLSYPCNDIGIEHIRVGFGDTVRDIDYFEGHIDLLYQNSNYEWMRPNFEIVKKKYVELHDMKVHIIIILSGYLLIIIILSSISLITWCRKQKYVKKTANKIVQDNDFSDYDFIEDRSETFSEDYESIEMKDDDFTKQESTYAVMSPTLPCRNIEYVSYSDCSDTS